MILVIVGVVIVLVSAAVVPNWRLPSAGNAAHLGWMSEQWLAEHRASTGVGAR